MPYVVEVARKLLTKSFGESVMDIEKSLFHYEAISSCLKLEPKVILEDWDRWSDYIDGVTVKDVPSLSISLISAMKESCNLKISKHCLNLVSNYLDSSSQGDWKQILATDDFNLKLLEVYHPSLLPFFIDAFKESLRDYALDNSITPIPKNVTERAIKILSDMGYDNSIIFKDIFG